VQTAERFEADFNVCYIGRRSVFKLLWWCTLLGYSWVRWSFWFLSRAMVIISHSLIMVIILHSKDYGDQFALDAAIEIRTTV
jgi:hypothetical protein